MTRPANEAYDEYLREQEEDQREAEDATAEEREQYRRDIEAEQLDEYYSWRYGDDDSWDDLGEDEPLDYDDELDYGYDDIDPEWPN